MMRDPDFQENVPSESFMSDYPAEELKPNIWQRLSRVMEVLIYVLALAGIAKLFWPEVERQENLSVELAKLEDVREARQGQVADLRQQYELLKTDRHYLESVARDRLNLMRGDEYVVRIERPTEEE